MKTISSLLAVSVALLIPSHADAQTPPVGEEPAPPPKTFLSIPLSYANDPKLEERIDEIIEEYRANIRDEIPSKATRPPSVKKSASDLLWWMGDVKKPLGQGSGRPITLEEMYLRALKYSTQIKVFSDIPLIRETGIQEAKGQFDTRSFVRSAFERLNDPVGSLLQTGEAGGRFLQSQWTNEVGVAKRLPTGTDVRLSQEFGTLTNNSAFLTPDPQGNSRLKLSIIQPLLNGAGIAYNTAVLEIAKIDTRSAFQEQIRQSESHLLEICRAYWALYFARVGLLERRRYLDESIQIESELGARQDVDTVAAQLLRARSAVAFRKSDLVRAMREIANAQDRLRSLVNDPDLAARTLEELIPIDNPLRSPYPVNYVEVSRKALAQRPEILQGIEAIRAAGIRQKVTRNELLPAVNLLLEGYVAGLQSDYNFPGAWSNQFNQGGPGFLVGVSIEFPWENNGAKARHTRSSLELRQQFNQFQTTIDTVLLEVKVSARDIDTSWRDYAAKLEAVTAGRADLDQLTSRREIDSAPLPGSPEDDSQTGSEYLDRLLDSQSRLQLAEMQLAESIIVYQVAIVGLERATGNLLQSENISIVRGKDENGLPILELQKPGEVASEGKEIKTRKAQRR